MRLFIEGGDGIGYNQAEVNALCESIDTALTGVKTTMEEGWSTLTGSFRGAWIGEDEAGFEKTFAEELGKMYENMDSIIVSAETFIVDAANAWAEWQTNASQQFGGGSVTNLDYYQHASDTVTITAEEQTFGQEVNRGLQSSGAESTLVTAIDTYVTSITGKISGLNEGIETSKAFIGSEQATAMSNFIEGIETALTNITKMVDNFKTETIPELVKAYQSQQTTVAGDAATAKDTVANSVDSAVGGN